MAGIYIHVPFCASRCIYCDFFSTTQGAEQREAYTRAVCHEIEAHAPEGPAPQVQTVYFGGGTPSQLAPAQVARILRCIGHRFCVGPDVEITLEMNPDDVPAFLDRSHGTLRFGSGHDHDLPHINRVSLGIQSFHDDTLRLIRRRHDAASAIGAVRLLQQAGIDNISIDLIYGLPGQTISHWQHDLDTAFGLGIQHLSAYALSYEHGTRLWLMRQQQLVHETDDDTVVTMYQQLCQRAAEAQFEHYEISNFALPGRHSRHNSSYWAGTPYFGFGPGAHSYDGNRTRWANSPDLEAYLSCWNGADTATPPRTYEQLTEAELFDEAVMCGLRTSQGIDLQQIEHRFGAERAAYLRRMAEPHIRANALAISGQRLRLTQKSLMTSDDIMSDLMAEP